VSPGAGRGGAARAACNGLTVDQRGVYTSAPTTTITGDVTVGGGDSLVSLTVNGVDATVEGERYRADVPLDGDANFTDVWASTSAPPSISGFDVALDATRAT
jgi:hypothetical protein